ncbi:MAG: DUF805 domain-containing protein [Elusimicrobia bacterium]|nr:DUF805 domain-containing protein [Elusimicrobiota bacterium]
MKEYFLDVIIHKYADFSARASRKEFWMFYLIYFLIMLVLSSIFFLIMFAAPENNAAFGLFLAVFGLFIGLFYLAMLVPCFAMCVRRLHDAGLSGWLVLVMLIFSPILIIFGLLPPTEGPNQYDEK